MASHDSQLVVAGVDGSPESRSALRWAVRHGNQTDATVRALAVWHQPIQFGYPRVYPDREFEEQARKWLDEAVAELAEEFPDCRLEARVLRGHPTSVLLDHAREADLLVLGNKGRGSFVGMLVGSVALQCVHHAQCPVVVVR